ncbi:hypothetical protein G9A89_002914 [Geosiphon pyriformis]|nr:hypothetical protein G9A89_002914 [Geosiphon pyriformis]
MLGLTCSCSGSNRGPSACKADVITTTPQELARAHGQMDKAPDYESGDSRFDPCTFSIAPAINYNDDGINFMLNKCFILKSLIQKIFLITHLCIDVRCTIIKVRGKGTRTPKNRGKQQRNILTSTSTTGTPTRSSPRMIRRSQSSYPSPVNRHFIDSVPILEVTLRFDEDEYDVWRRQDTDEVNLFYMLRIKYPRDEDEDAWHQELEKLKREVNSVRVVEEGWFEGVWVPLEKAKDIARKYKIYDHVAALLESENSWPEFSKNKTSRARTEQRSPSISELPEKLEKPTNGISTSPPNTPVPITNGNLRNGITRTPTPKSKTINESRDLPTRLKEVEGERDQYKEELINLKRKLDETESYVNNSGSKKRRVFWAAVGAAAGAGIAAMTFNNLGLGFNEIAGTFSNMTTNFFG